MSNRHVRNFMRYYEALSKDIVSYQPHLHLDLERDLSRIRSSVGEVGIRFFLEYLPDLGKVFDLGLSQGHLPRVSIPFSRTINSRSHIPRLFKGMWLCFFTNDGCLKQNIDPYMIFLMRTLLRSCKKFKWDCPSSALYETTEEFYVTDRTLPDPSLDWEDPDSSTFDPSGLSVTDRVRRGTDQLDLFPIELDVQPGLLDSIQRSADLVSASFGLFEPNGFRHGPGAVSERYRGIEKFSMPRWSPRLEEQFPFLGTAVPLGYDQDWEEAEIPSRLLSVPKTITGPRLIAAEPTDNLWCQFSIMDYLYDRVGKSLLRNSIDFRSQEFSRQAALQGSLDASNATIDLKSASDRLSLWLVERMFKSNISLLVAMRASRTALVDLSIDKKLPKVYRLKKFTTQGAALTFPIQSIVFAALAIGAGLFLENRKVTRKNVLWAARRVRVFGDDIIVPKHWLGITKLGLEALYLKVNAEKTHSLGLFRESCGMDAYAGFDVTNPYITQFGDRAAPASSVAVLECSNNFAKKWLFHTAQMISSTLPGNIRANVPFRNDDAGSLYLFSFSGNHDPRTAKVRWNEDLQRKEVLVFAQKARKKVLQVEDSLSLRAFLTQSEFRPEHVPWKGIMPWRPLSRWEALPVVGKAWVPSTLV